eukprot:6375421-Heterocapsa_arctica.AAC.1
MCLFLGIVVVVVGQPLDRPRHELLDEGLRLADLGDLLLVDVLRQAADDRDVLGMAPRAAADDVAAQPRVVQDVGLAKFFIGLGPRDDLDRQHDVSILLMLLRLLLLAGLRRLAGLGALLPCDVIRLRLGTKAQTNAGTISCFCGSLLASRLWRWHWDLA